MCVNAMSTIKHYMNVTTSETNIINVISIIPQKKKLLISEESN